MVLIKWCPFSTLALVAFLSNHRTHAHGEPETEEEIKQYLETQRSIYHCYPEILHQVEQRKLDFFRSGSSVSWEQPSIPSKLDTLQFGSHDQSESDLRSDSAPSRLVCSLNHSHSSPKFDPIRNSTCVLSPTVRAGPYYHREGHPIRQTLSEWQQGLPLSLNIGVIDVETCKPVEGALVDLWHANATGYYAGHPNPAKGLEKETPQVGGTRAGLLHPFPRTRFEEQWLRGAWPTDQHGVARFNTIFPGYYTGRATHVHAEVHMEWEPTRNGTFRSKDVQYIGQFFFSDIVNESVDKMWPYWRNPVEHRTRNWRDSLKVFQESSAAGFHPLLDIIKLGSVIDHGLIGFITVGIHRQHHFDHHHNPTKSDFDF